MTLTQYRAHAQALGELTFTLALCAAWLAVAPASTLAMRYLPIAAILAAAGLVVASHKAALYWALSTTAALGPALVAHVASGTYEAALHVLLMGALYAALGGLYHKRWPLVLGLAGLLLVIAWNLALALRDAMAASPWAALALVGLVALAVVPVSVAKRKRWQRRFARVYVRFKTWE